MSHPIEGATYHFHHHFFASLAIPEQLEPFEPFRWIDDVQVAVSVLQSASEGSVKKTAVTAYHNLFDNKVCHCGLFG